MVFDDESSEYGTEQLALWFPGATIVRNQKNVGPDENSRLIMERFLASENNAVVIADSDMMYHPNWLVTLQVVQKRLS